MMLQTDEEAAMCDLLLLLLPDESEARVATMFGPQAPKLAVVRQKKGVAKAGTSGGRHDRYVAERYIMAALLSFR
jgi:hypothetical protein